MEKPNKFCTFVIILHTMATQLDKDIIRETSVIFDGREILITLTEDQMISMKLKGMKSGVVTIPIKELYSQLSLVSTPEEIAPSVSTSKSEDMMSINGYKEDEDMMISLHDIRHTSAIRGMNVETTALFDGILSDIIQERKKLRVKTKK